jgi:hypothetical protein
MVQAIEMQALIRAFSLMLRERVDETAGERLTTAVTCKPRMTQAHPALKGCLFACSVPPQLGGVTVLVRRRMTDVGVWECGTPLITAERYIPRYPDSW